MILKGEDIEGEEDQLDELGRIIVKAWIGDPIKEDEIGKFNVLIQEDTMRRAWGKALQQFRLNGKFVMLEQGYENMV